MKIYEALYNPSCCESSSMTMSVHKTKKGAYKAIRAHKEEEYNNWLECHRGYKRAEFKSMQQYGIKKIHSDEYKYDFDKWWGISETELLD